MTNLELLKTALHLIEELEPAYFDSDEKLNLYYSTINHLKNEISLQNDAIIKSKLQETNLTN